MVVDSFCNSVPKPSTKQTCNLDTPCQEGTFHWAVGEWTTCSGPCTSKQAADAGMYQTQDRVVGCRDHLLGEADKAKCPAPAPPTSQSCNKNLCAIDQSQDAEEYKWVECNWESCTALCGGAGTTGGTMAGTVDRQVFCESTKTQKVVPDAACSRVGAKPVNQKIGCNEQPCTATNWMTTPWGPCVNGKRFRTSHCHAQDGSNAADSVCNPATRPTSQEACVENVCSAGRADDKPSLRPDMSATSTSSASLSLVAALVAAAFFRA